MIRLIYLLKSGLVCLVIAASMLFVLYNPSDVLAGERTYYCYVKNWDSSVYYTSTGMSIFISTKMLNSPMTSSYVVADVALQQYQKTFGKPFVRSKWSVAKEIYYHILAVQWYIVSGNEMWLDRGHVADIQFTEDLKVRLQKYK